MQRWIDVERALVAGQRPRPVLGFKLRLRGVAQAVYRREQLRLFGLLAASLGDGIVWVLAQRRVEGRQSRLMVARFQRGEAFGKRGFPAFGGALCRGFGEQGRQAGRLRIQRAQSGEKFLR